jgi:hypothetical protein
MSRFSGRIFLYVLSSTMSQLKVVFTDSLRSLSPCNRRAPIHLALPCLLVYVSEMSGIRSFDV